MVAWPMLDMAHLTQNPDQSLQVPIVPNVYIPFEGIIVIQLFPKTVAGLTFLL